MGCRGAGAPVHRLVGLLVPGGSAFVHQSVAVALLNLTSESAQGREAVRACGGGAALRGVLACPSSAAAHSMAAVVLRNLGRV